MASAVSTAASQPRTTVATELADPSLLRGVPASLLLRRVGQIPDKDTKEDYYVHSKQLPELDEFVSYNWVTTRMVKFLTLALHYNLRPAICAAYVVAPIVWLTLLFAAAVHPATADSITELAVHLCFLGVLLCLGDLRHIYGLPQRHVFFDKARISQTDDELRQKGIEPLGAFLMNIKSIVIVFTDLYIRKLWTVYELAMVLIMNQRARVVVNL